MATDKIEILVEAKVREAINDFDKLKKEGDKLKKQHKNIGSFMKKNWLKIAAGIAAAVVVIKKAFDFSRAFAKFEQSVQAMEKQFGVSSDKIIKKLKEVSDGTLSNADIVSSANKAMALNVTQDIGQMAKLLEVARVRGRAMGLDTSQAFNDLATGIGRRSPLILDNLGIITKGWDKEAKAAGVAMDSQFILNKVLDDGAKILEKTGPLALTNAEKFSKFGATMDDLKLKIGEKLLPIFSNLAEEISKIFTTEKIDKLSTNFALFLNNVIFGFRIMVNGFADFFDNIGNLTLAIGLFADASKGGLANLRQQLPFILKEYKAQAKATEDFRKIAHDGLVKKLLANEQEIINGKKEKGDQELLDLTDKNNLLTENDKLMLEIRTELDKKAISEKKSLQTEYVNLAISSEKLLTDMTAIELKKRIDQHKKFEELRTAASKAFVDGILGGLEDFKSGSKTVFASVVRSFTDLIVGQLAGWAATEFALSLTPPPIGGPQHLPGAVGLTAAAGTVKVLGNEAASAIMSAAHGADFVTNGPQMMVVGDNPSGREHVQVTPAPNNTTNNDNKEIHFHGIQDISEARNELLRTEGLEAF